MYINCTVSCIFQGPMYCRIGYSLHLWHTSKLIFPMIYPTEPQSVQNSNTPKLPYNETVLTIISY